MVMRNGQNKGKEGPVFSEVWGNEWGQVEGNSTWVRLVQKQVLFSTDQPCILVYHWPSKKTKLCFRWKQHLRLHFFKWVTERKIMDHPIVIIRSVGSQVPLMTSKWQQMGQSLFSDLENYCVGIIVLHRVVHAFNEMNMKGLVMELA